MRRRHCSARIIPAQYDAGVVSAAQLPFLGGTPGPLAKGLTKDVALIPLSDVDVVFLPDFRVSPAGHASKAGLAEEAQVRADGFRRAHAVLASSHRAGGLSPFLAVGGSPAGIAGTGGACGAGAAAELGPLVFVRTEHPPLVPQPALLANTPLVFERFLVLDAASTWFSCHLNSLYLLNDAIAGIFTTDMVEFGPGCNGRLIGGTSAEVGRPVSLAGARSLVSESDPIPADDNAEHGDIATAVDIVPPTGDEMSTIKFAASCPVELNDTAHGGNNAALSVIWVVTCIASLFMLLAIERRRKTAVRRNTSITVTTRRGSDAMCSLGQNYAKLSGRFRLATFHRYFCALFISVATLSTAAGELLGDQADKVCYIHAFMQCQ